MESLNHISESNKVIITGKIYTSDASNLWAESILFQNSEIKYVGLTSKAQELAGTNYKEIKLNSEHLLLPGFVDSIKQKHSMKYVAQYQFPLFGMIVMLIYAILKLLNLLV